MSIEHGNRLTRVPTWRTAGLWIVLLAVGLGVLEVVLAIQQAWSFTHRLMAQAEAQASRLADQARERFDEQLFAALTAVPRHGREGGALDGTWQRNLLPWVDGVYAWNGKRVDVLLPPSDEMPPVAALLEGRIRDEQTGGAVPPDRPNVLRATVADRPAMIAWMPSKDRSGRPIIVAGGINLQRLKTDLLEPLLSSATGLELAPTGRSDRPWSQPLSGAMEGWSIQPTAALVREQRSTVWGQALTYSGLTILSLAVLLIAMWVLVRLMRKEMALAAMKSHFVADVSHELKTPLALIRMFGETLQSGRVASEQKRQEYYRIITRESIRLTNLINNILDFAQIEAGRGSYTFEPISIGEVVRETFESYRAQLDDNGFEHHVAIEPSLPIVNADRDAIAQALINLINNAIKYSGDERYLAVDVVEDVRRDRRGVLISVHDRGIGIPPDERARVFEGFFRASDGRVREQHGTGLGLALVKNIVEAHQGSLDVESRLVKGSTFRIFLPESEQKGTSDEPA